MKKTIYLVHYDVDWHNGDTEHKTYAFVSVEKAAEKHNALNKKIQKLNGGEFAYVQHGENHDFYENDCEDRFRIWGEKTTLSED